jgi:DNA processing protein
MTERQALVALYSYIPFGPARTKLLVDYFGSAKEAWRASEKKLIEVGLKADRVGDFIKYRDEFASKDYFNRLKKLKIDFFTINDANYPENLLDLENASPVLYIRGKISVNDSNAVAIVGSRKMTSYGREVTEKFAQGLARLGITIVSGLARGIDTVAHKGALAMGGRTLAVLACGLDATYPLENTQLANEIIAKGGAILSEYRLGYPALRNNFASRNRIISGLSKAVIVIEGAKKSGTLLTASAAAEQGRPVFAVPGQITSPMSAAPLFLLQSGAKMAISVNDILDELDLQLKVDKEAIEKVMPGSPEEEKLVEILANEPLHLDEIARISTLDVATVSARLTIMELKGLVRNTGGGIYKKV